MQEGEIFNHQTVSHSIRQATVDDAPGILAIYGPVVETSAASFETEVPTASEMAERIEKTTETHQWLVAIEGETILGYAYAGIFRMRAAYAPSTEVSTYVGAAAQGKGVGRALLTQLLADLRARGFANAFAGITLPNEASVRLFESAGFARVGTFFKVGYKFDEWHDVGWWQLDLSAPQDR
jgi:L-amino acid N-acyltransferase YncA